MWDGVVEGLGSGYRVLRYDLPGHGTSPDPRQPYGMAALAEQLAAVLDGSGVARAHVVGMSLGGLVAQEFAGRFPGRVDRLVLVDTTPQYPAALKQKWVERAATARSSGVAAMIEEKLGIWFTPEFVAAGGPAIQYVRATLAACSGEGYARACEALQAADLRDSVRRIRAPTLILLGDGDLPPFHEAAAWMAARIADSRVALIENARHAAPIQQPREFVRLVREFLASPI